jgi:hypothetical protein
MGDAHDKYERATAAVRAAEEACAKAESDLIRARREQSSAWRAYHQELFPTAESLRDYFAPPVPNGERASPHLNTEEK